MSKGLSADDKCIFIGGLRRDLPSGKLKSQLKYLFKCIGVDVKKNQMIIVNNTKSDYCFGFVDFQDVDTVEYVLHRLKNDDSRNNFHFDFTTVQDPNKRLKFDYKKPPNPNPHISENVSNNGQTDSSWMNATKIPFSSPSHHASRGINAQTSTTGLPTNSASRPGLPPIQNAPQLSMATSVSGLEPKLPEHFYRLNDMLGNETRTMEFKQGGFVASDRKYVLQDNIGKYVCAFLNTDGGTLLVGVDNDGRVVGIKVGQSEEDKHRLSIDQAVKQISPPLLPSLYNVNFVPVVDQFSSISADLKVLEVKVKDIKEHSNLYVFRGDAYIRRDGSVQLLKAREIQEWEKKKLQQVKQDKEEVLHKLVERTEQLQVLQKENAQLQQKRDKKAKESRICAVM